MFNPNELPIGSVVEVTGDRIFTGIPHDKEGTKFQITTAWDKIISSPDGSTHECKITSNKTGKEWVLYNVWIDKVISIPTKFTDGQRVVTRAGSEFTVVEREAICYHNFTTGKLSTDFQYLLSNNEWYDEDELSAIKNCDCDGRKMLVELGYIFKSTICEVKWYRMITCKDNLALFKSQNDGDLSEHITHCPNCKLALPLNPK